MTTGYDFAVIGGGIAGASVAGRLAAAGRSVALLEMESQPGYHTTGRSAAIFAPCYGLGPVRALARASEHFFHTPPAGFSDVPLISPRMILMIARADQLGALDALMAEVDNPLIRRVNAQTLRALNPLVRDGYAEAGMRDDGGQDIDVGALHQGFLRLLKGNGGALVTNGEVTALHFAKGGWQLQTRAGEINATTVVNAAGAWADKIGALAGAGQIGLTPMRRTAAMIAAPEGMSMDAPFTIDIEEQFYLKPDAGRLLISPADETPSAPCDAQPDEMDIAICADRIETAFDLSIRRIEHKWAGLRSFAPDRLPVAGYASEAENFYWLAGQGGYGIETSPALSDFAATALLGQDLPEYLAEVGLTRGALCADRIAAQKANS